jgi:hypothetical protein
MRVLSFRGRARPPTPPAGGASPPGPPERNVACCSAPGVMPPLHEAGSGGRYVLQDEKRHCTRYGSSRDREACTAGDGVEIASFAVRVLGDKRSAGGGLHGFPHRGRGGDAPRKDRQHAGLAMSRGRGGEAPRKDRQHAGLAMSRGCGGEAPRIGVRNMQMKRGHGGDAPRRKVQGAEPPLNALPARAHRQRRARPTRRASPARTRR